MRLVETIRYYASEHHSPKKLAIAVFVGILIGVSPFYGFHLLLCLVAAFLLRLNKPLVYLAANISVPFFAPFIILASYIIGHLLFTGTLPEIQPISYYQETVGLQFRFILVGSLVLGSSLGVLFAGPVYFFAKTQVMKKNFPSVLPSAIKLFSSARQFDRFNAGFIFFKSLCDKIYSQGLCLTKNHKKILDVGGGQGIFSLLHALIFPGDEKKRVVVDWDEKKISFGKQISTDLNLNVQFYAGDVHEFLPHESFDAIVCLDVLHYNPIAEQKRFLSKLAAKLEHGGILIIRDMNQDFRLRTKITLLQESFSLFFGLTKANKLYAPSFYDLKYFLEGEQMEIESLQPCWGLTPFSNCLLVGRKK